MRAAVYVRSTALAASLVLVAMACSDAANPGGEPPSPRTDVHGDTEDSGPGVDSTPDVDASVDAPVDDADAADAAAPTCTDENWCHTPIPSTETLRDVWGDGTGVVWTVSTQGNIFHWDPDGGVWEQSYAAGTPLYAVWGSGPNDLWVGGDDGFFHGTGATPATMTWTAVSAGGAPIRSIWGRSASDIWATGYTGSTSTFTGYVLHYTGTGADPDSGTGWTPAPVATAFPARYTKVWGTVGHDDVWVGGQTGTSNDGRVVRGTPDGAGGHVWTLAPPAAVGRYFTGAGFLTPNEQIVIGFDPQGTSLAGFYTGVRDDDGAFAWSRFDGFNRGNATLNAVGGTGHDDVWVAGAYGRLRHWDGAAWRVARTALDDVMPVVNTLYAMWVTSKDDVWVVGNGIALHKVPPQKK